MCPVLGSRQGDTAKHHKHGEFMGIQSGRMLFSWKQFVVHTLLFHAAVIVFAALAGFRVCAV